MLLNRDLGMNSFFIKGCLMWPRLTQNVPPKAESDLNPCNTGLVSMTRNSLFSSIFSNSALPCTDKMWPLFQPKGLLIICRGAGTKEK